MQDIYDTKNDFPFEDLVFISPKNIPGGNYFIKFFIKDKPLYIQPPKCKTKNGILKSASKKMYCDLMFTNENEKFIQWMENLENYCHQMIFKNKEKWFETELDLPDIENSFTSPLKIFKSGKFYISRTNIPNALGKCILKIYDEDENEIHYETIKDNMDVMTILEIQGIKCSPRNFQIEIEMKQMMVLKPANIFEKCIFTQTREPKKEVPEEPKKEVPEEAPEEPKKEVPKKEVPEEPKKEVPEEPLSSDLGKKSPIQPENLHLNTSTKHGHFVPLETPSFLAPGAERADLTDKGNSYNAVAKHVPLENCEDVKKESSEDKTDIQEIDFDLDKINEKEPLSLKTKNDIYYKLYNDARKKAKFARDLAISSYLEAKNIKNKYQLNENEESDSDFDDLEIEDE